MRLTLLRKRIIGRRLVELSVSHDRVGMYATRLTLEWCFAKVIVGSAIWQMYKKKRQ